MVGKVITHELNMNNIEAGVVAVLKDGSELQIVTVQHLDQDGHWVVMGNDTNPLRVPIKAELCKLMVIDESGSYPLKFNQWKNAIRNKEVNTNKPVEFELVSPKFKEGKHVKVCTDCTAHFIGALSQATCKKCCDADYTAKILISKSSVKPKRPRIRSAEEIQALIREGYELGALMTSKADFETWLKNKF